MHTTSRTADLVKAQSAMAALLSILLPGLGQIYKDLEAGFLWLCFGMPLAIWVGILLALARAGLGLLLPLLCWAGIVVDAYYKPNRRSHHWFPRLNV